MSHLRYSFRIPVAFWTFRIWSSPPVFSPHQTPPPAPTPAVLFLAELCFRSVIYTIVKISQGSLEHGIPGWLLAGWVWPINLFCLAHTTFFKTEIVDSILKLGESLMCYTWDQSNICVPCTSVKKKLSWFTFLKISLENLKDLDHWISTFP